MECSGLVGRVLDMGSKGSKFETHRRDCVKKIYPLLSIGSTQEDRKASNYD